MTIASEITRINNNIASAYTACNGKGATMPATQNSANLATCIGSIQTGGGGGVGITREVSQSGVFQMPASSFTFSLPSNATDLGYRALYFAFNGCTGLTSVDLSSLTSMHGDLACNSAFSGCTNLTSADFSNLTTIGDYSSAKTQLGGAFSGCTGLTSVDLSSLTAVTSATGMQNTFNGCTGLTSVDLSSLETVSGNNSMSNIFKNCTNLASINFSNLTTIGNNSSTANTGQFYGAFNGCTGLTSLTFPNLEKIYCTSNTTGLGNTFSDNDNVQKMYFPKLNTITYGSGASSSNQNGCKYIFSGCYALTELHFGAANQAAIEATAGYSTAWGRGAGNVTIYFDL